MPSMRLAMDAAFWDVSVSSSKTLDGSARAVPGEGMPLFASPSCRTLRLQQLLLLSNGFPLGIIPSFSPTNPKDLGSFAIQSLLLKHAARNWWYGLVGQFRPKKLITSLKAEFFGGAEEFELPAFKDVAKHFLNKSLYSIGFGSQLSLSPSSSLYFSAEPRGDEGYRTKAMLFHKIPYHDITLEAAWPELFVDKNGAYWDVPSSISFDISSLIYKSGLRYRFGIHKNGGHPHAYDAKCSDSDSDVPLALLPGICAKAAFSIERSRDIWRQKEKKKDLIVETKRGRAWQLSYDSQLREPHVAVSGIIGGTCAAWLGGNDNFVDSQTRSLVGKRCPLSADFFSSMCCTFQHGKFRKLFGDLTRVDACLDFCSASAFFKGATNLVSKVLRGPTATEINPFAVPKLNLIFQQQVMGPIVFRVDSRLSSSGSYAPNVDDIVYSLSYSLRLLQSGKVLFWYSPKRKEGMIELRMFEF